MRQRKVYRTVTGFDKPAVKVTIQGRSQNPFPLSHLFPGRIRVLSSSDNGDDHRRYDSHFIEFLFKMIIAGLGRLSQKGLDQGFKALIISDLDKRNYVVVNATDINSFEATNSLLICIYYHDTNHFSLRCVDALGLLNGSCSMQCELEILIL